MRCILFLFFLLPVLLSAQQDEFEKRYDIDQVQTLLTEGIAGKDQRKQALAWYYWAIYDKEQSGITDSAFQYLSRSAERFLLAKDTHAYYRVRADLADHIADRKLYDEALQHLQEALDYAKKTKNLRLETHILARMSKVHSDKGDNTNALRLKREYTAKNQELKDTILDIVVAMYEVKHNAETGRYALARYEASNALRLAEQIKRQDYISWGQFNVGRYSLLDGDHNMALFFLKKAERSTPRTNLTQRRDVYRNLAQAYLALDSLPQAVAASERAIQISDSMLVLERENAVHRLTIQFDTREKLKDIEKLKEEKSAVNEVAQIQKLGLGILAVALFAVLLALFFIVRDYRHRIEVGKVIAAQREEINQQKIKHLENDLIIERMQSMLAGQESERQRVAQDLHDSVGGLLAAVKIQLEHLSAKHPTLSQDDDWAKMRTLLDETVSETRHIARNMQPSALLEFGFVAALRDLCGRVRGVNMPHITFQAIGEFEGLDRDLELNCYRIVQELLQNSLKHAKAKEILVQVTHTDNHIALLVEDDGVGFDPKLVKKGMGTDNIARRARFLKGDLSVHTEKGQGTSTLVSIPAAG